MLNEGRILADRYEITGKIGTGGMSDVYKAKDHKLNRNVALKVLKAEFSENKNFVTKFNVEAQSAAGLMHPNIVNVYDVGSEDGMYYIVMELVEGITLKKYIEKKIRLSFKETISIAIQVSMGIESAHNNHIIHRDIKPQNIMISKEGKVKVTDFGIARAATSNTITSNAMGSVHYTSPEQARGGYSDEKSDIYSLGVTMFEMLTGRVPFDGDTTVSIAIKHIQEQLPNPMDYAPDIPISAVQIIQKCCNKNAAKRYQTMGELIIDLKKALISPDESFVIENESVGGETRVITPENQQEIKANTGSFGYINISDDDLLKSARESRPTAVAANDRRGYEPDEDNYYDPHVRDKYDEYDPEDDEPYEVPVREVRRAKSSTNSKNKGKASSKNTSKKNGKKTGKVASSKTKSKDKTRGRDRDRDRERQYERDNRRKRPNTRGYEDEIDEDEDDIDPRMEKVMGVLGIIAAVIIAIIAIIIVSKMFNMFKSTTGSDRDVEAVASVVTMPEVTGMSFEKAKAQLKELGLEVQSTYVSSATVEKDQVISQNIQAGETLQAGSVVELTVSSGKDGITVPDVSGMPEAEARVRLEENGFVMVKDESASDSVPKGNVISQNPGAGESVQKGATITVIISTGASTNSVTVPDVRMQTEADARILIAEAALVCAEVKEEPSDIVPMGCVVAQSYAPNVTVPEGTSISLTISSGIDPNAVPTYKCNYSVMPPAGYSGGNAQVTLTQEGTGIVLFSTTTTSFPVAINLENITGSPNAVLSITYTVSNTVVIENEDGTPNSIVSEEPKTETQQVALTPQ